MARAGRQGLALPGQLHLPAQFAVQPALHSDSLADGEADRGRHPGPRKNLRRRRLPGCGRRRLGATEHVGGVRRDAPAQQGDEGYEQGETNGHLPS